MSRDLLTWARELPGDLRRGPAIARAALGGQRGALLARVRRRLPRVTGDLASSYETRQNGAALVVASDDLAAEATELGVAPRGSPWLAIPLHASLRRLSSPRADGKLVAIRLRDGRLFLGRRSGGRLDLRWRLARTVRAPRGGVGAVRSAVLETLDATTEQVADRYARALVGR